MDLSECHGFSGTRHPWEVERLEAVVRILRGRLGLPGARILDIGGGDGYVAQELVRRFPSAEVAVVDTAYGPDEGAARFTHPAIRWFRDLGQIGAERYDVVLLLDVVEHVVDDQELLRRSCAAARLGPAGRVLVFAPAFAALFGNHDRLLGHLRRYRVAELRALAAGAGLAVERCGYLFPSLLLVRAAGLLAERLGRIRQAGDIRPVAGWKQGPVVTRLVRTYLAGENRLALALARGGLRLPGLTAWTLCRAR